jgi:hypothetical protein
MAGFGSFRTSFTMARAPEAACLAYLLPSIQVSSVHRSLIALSKRLYGPQSSPSYGIISSSEGSRPFGRSNPTALT